MFRTFKTRGLLILVAITLLASSQSVEATCRARRLYRLQQRAAAHQQVSQAGIGTLLAPIAIQLLSTAIERRLEDRGSSEPEERETPTFQCDLSDSDKLETNPKLVEAQSSLKRINEKLGIQAPPPAPEKPDEVNLPPVPRPSLPPAAMPRL